jgi:hypothetical protein
MLFLDDSFVRRTRFLGYGGYCVSGDVVRELDSALREVKSKHTVPGNVELKWSPAKDHFLRTKFTGIRENLYRDVLLALAPILLS